MVFSFIAAITSVNNDSIALLFRWKITFNGCLSRRRRLEANWVTESSFDALAFILSRLRRSLARSAENRFSCGRIILPKWSCQQNWLEPEISESASLIRKCAFPVSGGRRRGLKMCLQIRIPLSSTDPPSNKTPPELCPPRFNSFRIQPPKTLILEPFPSRSFHSRFDFHDF